MEADLNVAPSYVIDRFKRRGIKGAGIDALSAVFVAMRKAQIEIGRGHCPLDAVAAALPAAYVENWMRERLY